MKITDNPTDISDTSSFSDSGTDIIFGQDDDGYPTHSSQLQQETEDTILPLYLPFKFEDPPASRAKLSLYRDTHVKYLYKGLESLTRGFVSLDASRPWLVYWMLKALDLLGEELSDELKVRATSTLSHCQHPSGGFGGGPGQLAHLATTYAAVNALAIVGTKEAYDVVDRHSLLSFFTRLKQPDGSFLMHDGGEADGRGTYCIASCARLLNLPTTQLFTSAPEFIARCQSYEGGLSGYPGVEAHGGYTFCGFAAMELMGKAELVDLDALATWIVQRQMSFEGGFSGRTNKLVDGCYSFWQGGTMPILEVALTRRARRRGTSIVVLVEVLGSVV
ncbi:hypothetical protein HDV00_010589 [Rhizophlyctis rosea]|nr:hypothetical protein HDV00_010589 [Rhizophlyctis rosea]